MKRGRDDLMPAASVKRAASGNVRPTSAAPAGAQRLTTTDALTYLRDVKVKFQNNKQVYDTFLEIMKEFKAQKIDTNGVIERVKNLFKGHKELILGFNTFLPKGYEIHPEDLESHDEPESKQPVEFDQAINYVNKIKLRFLNDERVYKAFLEILNMYRKGQKSINNVYDEVAVLFRNHEDLLEEFTYFLPDSSGQAQMPGVNKRLHQRGPPGAHGGPPTGPRPPRPSLDSRGPRPITPSSQPSEMMNKQRPLRPGEEAKRTFSDEEDGTETPKSALERELQFFEKVKQRIRNKEVYQDFLRCLNLLTHDIITKQELMQLVGDVLGKSPELMAGFQRFLHACETLDLDVSETKVSAPAPTRHQHHMRDASRLRNMTQREKFLSKPLSELAGEIPNAERCTTSYVKVPSGYPRVICSGRTPLGNELLNDVWVSIISGSEDYSFKLMRKNGYEEALFRAEDDRYELDMCISQSSSALKILGPLVDEVSRLTNEQKANYTLGMSRFKPPHLKIIERIYGDVGGQIVEYLRKNPIVALPLIQGRLVQKDAEWRQVREDMNGVWKKIYETNYHKSLDHRSFYFKQADKKALLPKTMFTEIKEIADKKKQDDHCLKQLSVACCLEDVLSPDITYEYTPLEVHDDCYRVVKWAVEELSAPLDVKEAIMQFWLQVVEPFFALPPRDYEGLHARDSASPPHHEDDEGEKSQMDVDADESDSKSDSEGDGEGEANTQGELDNMVTPEMEEGMEVLAGLMEGDTQDPDADEDDAGHEADEETSAGEAGGSGNQGGPGTLGDDDDDEEDEEEEDEDEEAGPEGISGRNYDLCQPLATVRSLDGGPKRHVLYGNDSIYYFFRYHRHLFERLGVARRCCRDKNQPQFRQTGEVEQPMDPEAKAQAQQEADALHSDFMALLQAVMDSSSSNRLDSNTYEDKVRSLLGTNSYVLFTLDKLVQRLVKHVQIMLQEEHTCRLTELFKYEMSRTVPVRDSVYYANHRLIATDDNCFRLEYLEPTHQLTLQLIDSLPREEVQAGSMEPMFADYLKGFLQASVSSTHPVYLQRNIRRSQRCYQDDPEVSVFKGLVVRNGLECKIQTTSSKVAYVLDTEDFMYRLPRTRKHLPYDLNMHRERFAQYLEKHTPVPCLEVPKGQ